MNQFLNSRMKDILNPETETRNCESHGEYEAKKFLTRWTSCPQCAAIESEKRQKQEAEDKRLAEIESWRRRVGYAGIPERFRDRTLESYTSSSIGQQRALEFAVQYADNFSDVLKTGRSAMFCGKPGTGKTHLAVGIGLQVMTERRSVLFITVMRAIRRVKATWDKGSEETESQAISVMTSPDLLILDEIGIQFGSETEKNILFDILNERYENRKPTLLLSNLTPKEVQSFLGERVFDRLREDGGVCITFDWDSYRKKA